MHLYTLYFRFSKHCFAQKPTTRTKLYNFSQKQTKWNSYIKKWKLNQWYIPISKCLTRYSYCLGLNTHQLCCKCIPEYVTAYNPEHIKSWQSYTIWKNNVENRKKMITTAHEHLHEQIAKDMIPHYYQVFWIVEIFPLSRRL